MITRLRSLACCALVAGGACASEGGGGEILIDPLVFVAGPFPEIDLGDEYDQMLAATGGTPPYRFSIAAGRLPDAISLSPSGRLSGPAAQPGTHDFTVKVEDAKGEATTAERSIRVRPDALEIVNRLLPSARESFEYDVALTARGGVAPYTWSISAGALPAGLAIDAASHLRGTPAENGVFDFTLRVTDTEGETADQILRLGIASLDPMITSLTVPKARVDQPYEAPLAASGGDVPFTWEVIGGELPPGLVLAGDGVLAGTPTEAGDFEWLVRVTDARGRTDMATIPIRVVAPLVITTAALNLVLRSRPYVFRLEATGGELPYTWNLQGAQQLPAGITFASDGTFSGTTVEIGTYPITARVTDAAGLNRSAMFTLAVSDRYVYEEVPVDGTFPPACTSTTVSYKYADIHVNESFAIDDVNVALDITYPGAGTGMSSLRIVLFSPDGAQCVLCGDEAGPWGGCAAGDLTRSYDDDGVQAVRPQRPLHVFDGRNARGTWRLLVATVEPQCNTTGTINSVELTFTDDRSPDPYLLIGGWETNNLVIEPFVHLVHPLYPDTGVGPHELFLRAAIYDVGPNGYREAGQGDDVLDSAPVSWAWAGAPIANVTLLEDGYVYVDGSNGVCTSGQCNGTGQALIMAAGGSLLTTTTLRVLPPDFNTRERRY